MGKEVWPADRERITTGASEGTPAMAFGGIWWHLDEMYVVIGGRWMYLWRAIDQNSEVLEILVQARRDKMAALKLMRKLLKKHGFAPRTIVTDKGEPMRQRFVIWGSTPGITKRNGRITASKDRTFAFADENVRCKAFDLPGSPSAFFRSMPPSTTISLRADISSQPPNIDTVLIKLSRHGSLPPALPPDSLFRWA